MKSILLIGVGEIGLNQIIWARDAGFHVITSNMDRHAPAGGLADVCVNISGTDTRGLVSYGLENQDKYNISAVYSGNDFGVFSVPIVSHLLGLPAISVKAVANSLSKILMKKIWLTNGISTPKFKLANTAQEAQKAIEELGLPVIIKPADSSGSQGIRYIGEMTSLEVAVSEAFHYTESDCVVLEEYFEGRHIDANGLFWNNRFYGCGLAERFFSDLPYRVPLGGYEPAMVTKEQEIVLYRLFEEAARCLGINHGPIKADFIVSENEIRIIEISARFHGDVGTSHNSFYRTGISPLHIYFETMFSGEVPLELLSRTLRSSRVAGWRVIDLPAGQTQNLVEAAEKAQVLCGVEHVYLDARKDGKFVNLRNNNDVVGFVWASGENRGVVDKLIEQFIAELREMIVYEM